MTSRGPDGTSTDLANATWLLSLIAKRMVDQSEGGAHVELTAPMVGYLEQFITDQASDDHPLGPSPGVAATMSLVGVATTLANGGHVAYRHQAQIRLDPRLRELGSELAGLLDIVIGLRVTNPDDRARRHLAVIDQMVDALGGQTAGSGPGSGTRQ